MDKELMGKKIDEVKTNSLQELNLDEMNKVSGGGSHRPFSEYRCSVCGGIKGDASIPDDLRCHCQGVFI